MQINDEEEVIYFALSNLIKDCSEFLESAEKAPKESIPKEDIEFVEYIFKRTLEVLAKKEAELQKKP